MDTLRSLLATVTTLALVGCSATTRQNSPEPIIRVHITHLGPTDSVLPIGYDATPNDRDARASTTYQVSRCQSESQCVFGIAKPQVGLEFLQTTKQSIEIKAIVVYDVGDEQSLKSPGLKTTASASGGIPPNRTTTTKTLELQFGEQRRLQLPFGDAIIFCAQRVSGPARQRLDPCPAPETVGDIQKIEAL